MKSVYVDACLRAGAVCVFVDEDERVMYDYSNRKLQTHEAECFAIIMALVNVDGDLKIKCDNLPIVRALNGENRTGKKLRHYIVRIKELCRNRNIDFIYVPREQNKADFKSRLRMVCKEFDRIVGELGHPRESGFHIAQFDFGKISGRGGI